MALSWRPAALMACGLIPAMITNSWLVVIVWAVAVGVLCIVDYALAASPRSLSIARTVPFQVRLSQATNSQVRVGNSSRRRAVGIIKDSWTPSAGALENLHRIDVAPGGQQVVSTDLMPTRRGERTAQYVTARLFGPLKCAARQYTFDAASTLRVLPEFKARKHLPSRIARLRELEGQSAVQFRGAGTEFDSLRQYVEGDDVRSIDWRATARAREVTVRTWRPERDRHVVIVIDSSRTSAPRVNDEPRLDSFIESALLLGALASRAGDRVEVIAFDRKVRTRLAGPTSQTIIHDMGVALSNLEPQLVETDWDALGGLLRSVVKQRSLVVFLTNSSFIQADVGILSTIGSLAKHNVVVTASVADPDIATLATHRGDSAEVFEAAAAERALLDEKAGSDHLARSGVVVVRELPLDLAPRLSDTYIELKATGRL